MNELKEKLNKIIDRTDASISFAFHSPHAQININTEKRHQAASLVKVLIMIEAYRQADRGQLDLNSQITIPNRLITKGTGVIAYLTEFPSCTIKNLVELMIIVSDNTASNLLIDILGFEKINDLGSMIGCNQLVLQRKFMDYNAIEKGLDNYISASDCIKLLKVIAEKNSIVSDQSREEMLEILSNQQFSNIFSFFNSMKKGICLFSKTGELDDVLHDMYIIQQFDTPYYLAVLTSNWDKNEDGQMLLSEIGIVLTDYFNKY